MKIAGFVKNSFVDYPGCISAVIFTFGCPLSCYYCHNKHLLDTKQFLNQDDIFQYLSKRKNLLDAVVISGGEPTIQPDLEQFISKIKDMNLLVKLDTCGVNPDVVKNLIQKRLVDYVAMDIKGPLEKYDTICNTKVDKNKIKDTIQIIKQSDIEYEFRTTLVPEIDQQGFDSILQLVNGAKHLYIQKCNYNFLEKDCSKILTKNAEKYNNLSKTRVKHCALRGFD